jgi:tRNA(Ile)-lysidine synthase
MKFSPDILYQQLLLHPAPAYRVAYSGGLDSHVLLHALVHLRDRLDVDIGAVHVNHALQADADSWEEHCRNVCAGLEVNYESLRVDARAATGESQEAAARDARYAALAAWLPAGEYLLTAQHQDDQAETLLLQLLRGSGVNGLAAMPVRGELGHGQLLRPLLGVTRRQLQAYAEENGLSWLEDPSNRDTAFDRNFLRASILPLLQERWPAVTAVLARSAAHCAEASKLLSLLGEQDLADTRAEQKDRLSLTRLIKLPLERQRNVLRYWIVQATGVAPSTAVLARILNDVLQSRLDAEPCVRWREYELRRYRDELYLLKQRSDPDATQVLQWSLPEPLSLPDAGGVLNATRQTGCGIRASAVESGVQVSWRRGGERCLPVGRGQHHSLKKLFQEQGIPPWERSRIPLIYIGDQLAAVAGLWVCEPFHARPAEPGLLIDWQKG